MKQRLDHKTQGRESAGWAFALVAFALAIHGVSEAMHAAEAPGASEFRKTIRPILETYCFDCHADGAQGFATARRAGFGPAERTVP